MKKGIKSKQETGFVIGLVCTFQKLILSKIDEKYPVEMRREKSRQMYHLVRNNTDQINALEKRIGQLHSMINQLRGGDEPRVSRLKQLILREAALACTERFNEKRIATFTAELKKAQQESVNKRTAYEQELAEAKGVLKQAESDYGRLKTEEAALDACNGNNSEAKLKWLEYCTGVKTNGLLHFFRFRFITSRSVRLYTEANRANQSTEVLALCTMVPEWQFGRLIYFYILCEALCDHDRGDTKIQYCIGEAQDLLGGIAKGNEIWVRAHDHDMKPLYDFYLALEGALDGWFQKPLSLGPLLADPLIRSYAEYDDLRWTRKMESPFVGGRSLIQQIMEFYLHMNRCFPKVLSGL